MLIKQIKKWKAKLLALGCLAGLIACSQSSDMSSEASSDNYEEQVQDLLQRPEQIVFSDVHRLVFSRSCMECHDSKRKVADVDLSSIDTLKKAPPQVFVPFEPEFSSLYTTISMENGPRKMPPDSHQPVSVSQRELVFQWIRNGGAWIKDTAFGLSQKEQTYYQSLMNNPQVIDYNIVRREVFQKGECLNCHSRDGRFANSKAYLFGVDMTNYENLYFLNGIRKGFPSDKVVRDDSGRIRLIEGSKIYKGIENQMLDKTDNYNPHTMLGTGQVEILRLWILNCAIKDYESVQGGEALLEASAENPGKVRACH